MALQKINEALLQEIIAKYQSDENLSLLKLGQMYNVNVGTIEYQFKKRKIVTHAKFKRSKKFTEEKIQEAIKLYQEDETLNLTNLGKRIGLNRKILRHHFYIRGIPIRQLPYGYNRREMPEELIQKMIRNYTENKQLTLTALAKSFDLPTSYVCKAFKEKGVELDLKRATHPRLAEDEQKEVCRLYMTGVGAPELSKNFDIGQDTVMNYVKKHGGVGRTRSQRMTKYSVDTSYFEKIDTHNKAYFLGMLITDGYLTSTSSIGIQLQAQDHNVLEFLRNDIQLERPLTYTIRKNRWAKERNDQGVAMCYSYILSIMNAELYQQLLKLGITPRKSLTCKFPSCVPKKYLMSFLCGVFDGDGSLPKEYKRAKYNLVFYVSTAFAVDLKKVLDATFNISATVRQVGKISTVSVYRECSIYQILKQCYANLDPKNCVQRKYLRFLELRKKLIEKGRIASTD
jgi:hypothetical protein